MPRRTTLEQRIDFYIKSFGLDPALVFDMTRTMLEEYKDRRNSLNPLISQLPPMTEPHASRVRNGLHEGKYYQG